MSRGLDQFFNECERQLKIFKSQDQVVVRIALDGNIISKDYMCDSDDVEKELRKIDIKVTKRD